MDNVLLKGHLFFCNTKTETAPDENMFRIKASFDSYSDHFAHQLVIFLRLKVSYVFLYFSGVENCSFYDTNGKEEIMS